MSYICDMCGKYSNNENICTNCGAEIYAGEEISDLPTPEHWGWATFSFDTEDAFTRADLLDYLREKWRLLENFTVMHLLKSQLSKFISSRREVKVLIREDFLMQLSKDLTGKFKKFSVTFKPISSVETVDKLNALIEDE